MACFQIPSLLIGKVWVPVKQFCVIHTLQIALESGQGPGAQNCADFTSTQPLILSTIREFSSILYKLYFIGIAGPVLSMLTRFYQIDHSTLWWTGAEVK